MTQKPPRVWNFFENPHTKIYKCWLVHAHQANHNGKEHEAPSSFMLDHNQSSMYQKTHPRLRPQSGRQLPGLRPQSGDSSPPTTPKRATAPRPTTPKRQQLLGLRPQRGRQLPGLRPQSGQQLLGLRPQRGRRLPFYSRRFFRGVQPRIYRGYGSKTDNKIPQPSSAFFHCNRERYRKRKQF